MVDMQLSVGEKMLAEARDQLVADEQRVAKTKAEIKNLEDYCERLKGVLAEDALEALKERATTAEKALQEVKQDLLAVSNALLDCAEHGDFPRDVRVVEALREVERSREASKEAGSP